MRSLSQRETALLAFLLGVLIWFWFFALAFSWTGFWRDATAPLLSCAAVAIVLGSLAPAIWPRTAMVLSLPTIILNLSFFAQVSAEGRGAEWNYLFITAGVVATAFSGAALGGHLPLTKRGP